MPAMLWRPQTHTYTHTPYTAALFSVIISPAVSLAGLPREKGMNLIGRALYAPARTPWALTSNGLL